MPWYRNFVKTIHIEIQMGHQVVVQLQAHEGRKNYWSFEA